MIGVVFPQRWHRHANEKIYSRYLLQLLLIQGELSRLGRIADEPLPGD